MKLKALIFDVDGTLADTEDAHRKAFNAAFAREGLDWNWDPALYKELLKVTGGKQRIRYFLELHHPDILSEPGIDAMIPELHAMKTEAYVAALEGGAVPLRPGIAELIGEARSANMTIAIATTTTPINVETLLTANLGAQSLNWFACIGDGGKVPVLKPEPDVYLYVLEELGLKAADCLALEDSHNGLVAAVAADLPCLIVTNPYTEGQDFSGAAEILTDWADVGLDRLMNIHTAAR